MMNSMLWSPRWLVRHVARNVPFSRKGAKTRKDRIHRRTINAINWLDSRIPKWREMEMPIDNGVVEVIDDE